MYRIDASKHASRSNMLYKEGITAHTQVAFYEACTEVMQKYSGMYKTYMILYAGGIIADTYISGRLIAPFAESFLQSTSAWSYLIVACIYASIIYIITTAACKNYYQNEPQNIALQTDLLQVGSPATPRNVFESLVMQEAEGSRKRGIRWAALLISLVLLLGLFRNYIIHRHQGWFIINSPDDILATFFPLVLTVGVLYTGRYKHQYFQLRGFSKHHKKWKTREEKLKHKTLDEGRKFLAYEAKADAAGEPKSTDKESKICKERMEHLDVTSERFFSNVRNRQVCLKFVLRGKPVPNIPVQACTEEDEVLYGVSNEEGICWIKWRSATSLLRYIKVYGKFVPGKRFMSNQLITMDLIDVTGRYDQLPIELRALFGNTPAPESLRIPTATSNHVDQLLPNLPN